MIDSRPTSLPERRVVPFRRGPASPPPVPPVPGLGRYEGANDDDDYRHRMAVNAAAFLFVLGLIAAGIWLAEAMAQMRRNQDCVLSGRPGCTPVEYEPGRY